jgi:hypothetical protein
MNRRIAFYAVLALLVVVAGAVLAACGAQEAETGSHEMTLDGKALAEERCSVCHPYARVEAAKKTAEEWKANVERMVAKGAQLDEAEQAAVIEYLSEAYPR